jgi:uncharacterized membrane protein
MENMDDKDMMENGREFDFVKSVDEANPYPSADKQFASNRKYMTYESISTGVGGKK